LSHSTAGIDDYCEEEKNLFHNNYLFICKTTSAVMLNFVKEISR
jgi:hypothetical protein